MIYYIIIESVNLKTSFEVRIRNIIQALCVLEYVRSEVDILVSVLADVHVLPHDN